VFVTRMAGLVRRFSPRAPGMAAFEATVPASK